MEIVAQEIHPVLAEDERAIAMLHELVATWARRPHPHLLRMFGMERSGDRWVLLTSPLPPYGLSTMARAAGFLPMRDRVGWAMARVLELADALAAYGDIHGRIEKEHIVFDREGRAMLLPPMPRGMEGHAVTGRSILKIDLRWLPSEICLGQTRSNATDVYGLGFLARVLLGAPSPYAGLDEIEVLERKSQDVPLPRLRDFDESIPEELDELLARATAFAPAARFEDAAALAIALVPFASDTITIAPRGAPSAPRLSFLDGIVQRPCSKRWEELAAREDDAESRHCAECDLSVRRVRSAPALLPLLGSCVFYDPDPV